MLRAHYWRAVLRPAACSIATVCTLVAGLSIVNGCALHYFDPDTQTEHVWGIGHMRMKASAASEDVRAIVSGTDVVGIAAGSGADATYVLLGWERLSQLRVVDSNTAVRLEWPDADLFNVRVGSQFPPRTIEDAVRFDQGDVP